MQPGKPKLTPVKTFQCKRCKKRYDTKRLRKYCVLCAKIVQREQTRTWWRKNRGHNTKHTIVCEACEYEVRRTSVRQKYCTDCGPEARRATLTEWRAAHPDYQKEYQAQRAAARIAKEKRSKQQGTLPLPLLETKKETKQ